MVAETINLLNGKDVTAPPAQVGAVEATTTSRLTPMLAKELKQLMKIFIDK